MNWRWLIYDHIPADLNVPKVQRRAIRKEVASNLGIYFEPHALKALSVGIVSILLSFYVFTKASIYLQPRYPNYGFLIMVLLVIHCHCLFAVVFRSLYQKKTYQLLRQSGYDICLECGYWLKGLDDSNYRCPECGKIIRKDNPA